MPASRAIFREKGSNDALVTDQLFLTMDKNDDGTVSVFELLRVVRPVVVRIFLEKAF